MKRYLSKSVLFFIFALAIPSISFANAEFYSSENLPQDLQKAAIAFEGFPSLNKLTDLSLEFGKYLSQKQGYREYAQTVDDKEYVTVAKKDDDGNISTKTFRTIRQPELKLYPVGFEFRVVMENGQLKGLETKELSEEEINYRKVMHSYDPAHLKQVTDSAKEKLKNALSLPDAKVMQTHLSPPAPSPCPVVDETAPKSGESPQAQGEKKEGDSTQDHPEPAVEGPSPAAVPSDFDSMLSSVDSMLKSNDALLTKLEQAIQNLDDLANKIMAMLKGSAQPGAAVTSNTATAEQLREQAAGLNRQARHQELIQSLRQSSEKAREAKGKSDKQLAELEAMISGMEDAKVPDEKIKPHREKLVGLRARSSSLDNKFSGVISRLEQVSASTPTLTDETIKIEEAAVEEASKSFAEFETEATSLEEQLKKEEEGLAKGLAEKKDKDIKDAEKAGEDKTEPTVEKAGEISQNNQPNHGPSLMLVDKREYISKSERAPFVKGEWVWGNKALDNREWDEAIKQFSLLLNNGFVGTKYESNLWERIGRALEGKGDRQGAIDAYRKAIETGDKRNGLTLLAFRRLQKLAPGMLATGLADA